MSSAYDDLEQRSPWIRREAAGTRPPGKAERELGSSFTKEDLKMAQTLFDGGMWAIALDKLKRRHSHAFRHIGDKPTVEQLAAAISYNRRCLEKIS
jgi:hypothetical protein